jgi:AraC-like DNA-binding protein
MQKEATVIAVLNRVIDFIEEHLTEEIDVAGLVSELGTTEYHVRRMFSSLAGMPLSEYVRRRRLTVAAADVIGGRDLHHGHPHRAGFAAMILVLGTVTTGRQSWTCTELRASGAVCRAAPGRVRGTDASGA